MQRHTKAAAPCAHVQLDIASSTGCLGGKQYFNSREAQHLFHLRVHQNTGGSNTVSSGSFSYEKRTDSFDFILSDNFLSQCQAVSSCELYFWTPRPPRISFVRLPEYKTQWNNLLSIMESASGDGCEAYVRASVWFYKELNGLYVIGVKCSILETTR